MSLKNCFLALLLLTPLLFPQSTTQLRTELLKDFPHVHEIQGFFIIANDQTPLETTPKNASAKEIFEQSVTLFSSFLDQDEDGKVDKPALMKALAKGFVFMTGYNKQIDAAQEKFEDFDKFFMAIHTDQWPYMRNYNGKFARPEKLISSTWRPYPFNSLWEEVFHTITEAYNTFIPKMFFEKGSPLSKLMAKEINQGVYDISEQNRIEKGDYDWITAVNEYIHQIWAYYYAGYENILTPTQKKALKIMQEVGVPMKVSTDYNGTAKKYLGSRLKG